MVVRSDGPPEAGWGQGWVEVTLTLQKFPGKGAGGIKKIRTRLRRKSEGKREKGNGRRERGEVKSFHV